MTEFNTELPNSILTNIINVASSTNDSLYAAYDYLSDNNDQQITINNSKAMYSNGNGPQHLATILQQLFSKMSDEKTIYRTSSNSTLSDSSSLSTFPTGLLPFNTLLLSSTNNTNSFYLLSLISFWIVLIINPIVISFGVTGNLLATYILIRCNIAKLPVSFYTIMLNISDTLNLLIPVLIFWLDNCINRTPERGYFRDRSNFLCKALMCPDQLFAALSAWYMCAISFNRWYSVCRPSSYFFRGAGGSGRTSSNASDMKGGQKKQTSVSTIISSSSSSFLPFCIPVDCCSCLTRNIKFRQHLQAFRSIFFITLMGVLCCLYPIFMHELRPVIQTYEHIFDLKQKKTRKITVSWNRCYYSEKHEYAYDIIGIILSCFLHILPLTFVAAMNIMIIVRLRKRQRLMTVSASLIQSQKSTNKRKKSFNDSCKRSSYTCNNVADYLDDKYQKKNRFSSQSTIITNRKDQATSTDLSMETPRPSSYQLTIPVNNMTSKRHHSRDRTITIMLVSVALSYLILTLPYRLFWSYNVYIKRVNPDKLKSSLYLLKMHYIDHILRTIRNVHYGTNFVFFIFLSKTFRRKFRQLFIEKILQTTTRLFGSQNSPTTNTDHVMNSKINRSRHSSSRLDKKQSVRGPNGTPALVTEFGSRSFFEEVPSFVAETPLQQDEVEPIIELEHNTLSRYDGK
ncbi:unnamed protein product [Adineta steineri]|uniref:G-protein coupled receptors family 1 profile domain-containing protein n=1 Tax=Adineta steineri TaxID=433720 RepID=A0A815H5U1_9BILA|nr:unnamed protein product [Adineta steineri]CAF3518236.1 unnamed protein product [Adineta steineri]